jgi:hypothetical protein
MRIALVLLTLVAAGCASSARSGAPAKGAVRGVVLSAPSCPVERAASPCPPRPLAQATVVLVAANDAQVEATAGPDGRFTVTIAPGPYEVTARNTGALPTTAHARVTVSPGATASVRLVVDSGIR